MIFCFSDKILMTCNLIYPGKSFLNRSQLALIKSFGRNWWKPIFVFNRQSLVIVKTVYQISQKTRKNWKKPCKEMNPTKLSTVIDRNLRCVKSDTDQRALNIWRPVVCGNQNIFEQNISKICSLLNNASFGTVCIPISQLFES